MFSKFLTKSDDEPVVSVDIGTSAIKLMVLDCVGSRPRLVSVAITPTPANSISNNAVTNPEQIGRAIRAALDSYEIDARRAVIGIPGPCSFSKKITIGYSSLKELSTNIHFEASNYIPHNIGAVRLDYQVLKTNGRSTMDVLLVAVKNEIVDSYVLAVQCAGLEAAIADVDYFALENMFEISYPDETENTLALVNIGARYAGVNLLQRGESLFTGDVGVGGRLYTDALCEALGMQPVEAEQAKAGNAVDGYDDNLVRETLERTTEHVAGELTRQLGFFWNATATDQNIEAIYLGGGGCQVSGLLEEIAAKTSLPCRFIEPFRGVEIDDNFDEGYLSEIALAMGASVGLASRRFGDKTHAIE